MYILIRFCLKTFLKIYLSYLKIMIIARRLPWGTYNAWRNVDNMLQLMRFSVYIKGILNTDNGYFHIKIIISAAHLLRGS